MFDNYNRLGRPGIGSVITAAYRRLLVDNQSARYMPGSFLVDGSKSRDPLNTGDLGVLRAGMVLGKITASGKYAPSILGVTTVAYVDNDVTLTVSAATAVELVRRIGATGTLKLTGPPTAAGTVATASVNYTAVNTATGVITVPDLNTAFVVGSFVQPADGSEAPLALLNVETGLKVTDPDGTSIDVELMTPLIGGLVKATQILNYPADASLKSWLKSKLNGLDGVIVGNAPFTYDDRY